MNLSVVRICRRCGVESVWKDSDWCATCVREVCCSRYPRWLPSGPDEFTLVYLCPGRARTRGPGLHLAPDELARARIEQ